MRNVASVSVLLAALGALAANSCGDKLANDCNYLRTCVAGSAGDMGKGGNGTAGLGGDTTSSGGTSGLAGAGAASGSGGNGGSGDTAGAGGEAPCNGDCEGATPVCDSASNRCVGCLAASDCETPKSACDPVSNTCVECIDKNDCGTAKPACDAATNTCVECIASTDCTDSSKPVCDTKAQACVACLTQADCTSATASACNAGVCAACTKDEECANIPGKGVCGAGTCVQCTVAKESVCGGKSCNPATSACTTTAVGTLDYCQPCLADSECIGGNQADPDARCVPMKFMGTARPGGFCLRRVAATCVPPFGVLVPASSLSGGPLEDYCGIDQSSTRCEAVLDLIASRACPDGMPTSCGCTRNNAGACIDSGQGGLCKTVGAFANQCTIPCALANQCPGTLTCPSAKPYCQ